MEKVVQCGWYYWRAGHARLPVGWSAGSLVGLGMVTRQEYSASVKVVAVTVSCCVMRCGVRDVIGYRFASDMVLMPFCLYLAGLILVGLKRYGSIFIHNIIKTRVR